MGDGDEEAGPLLEGLAVEVDGAILGDDPVGVGTRGDDARAGVEHIDDLALPLVGAGGKCRDGLAALGHCGAADKVELAAGAGEDARADGVGADLAGEVYLRGGIDGYHSGIGGDNPGVVGVFDVLHQDVGVMVYETVDVVGTQQEGGDDLAAVDLLAGAVDDAFANQAEDAVGEHLGVETEVAVVLKAGGEGVRKGAYAHLDAGPVGDKFGAVAANLPLNGSRLRKSCSDQRSIILDQIFE